MNEIKVEKATKRLLKALKKRDLQCCRRLLRKHSHFNFDLQENSKIILQLAVSLGSSRIWKRLLKHGMPVYVGFFFF